MHTYVCVSGGKKCQFFGKFSVCTKWMTPDDDNDDDHGGGFCRMFDKQKCLMPHFKSQTLPQLLTSTNLRYALNRNWTCGEPKLILYWLKLCSSDNHYTKMPRKFKFIIFSENKIYVKSYNYLVIKFKTLKYCKSGNLHFLWDTFVSDLEKTSSTE